MRRITSGWPTIHSGLEELARADGIDWAGFVFRDQSLARASVRGAQLEFTRDAAFPTGRQRDGVFQERKHCPTC